MCFSGARITISEVRILWPVVWRLVLKSGRTGSDAIRIIDYQCDGETVWQCDSDAVGRKEARKIRRCEDKKPSAFSHKTVRGAAQLLKT